MPGSAPVFVIDDDPAVLELLGALLATAGFEVRTYPSASAFLEVERPVSGCLIIDVKMPEIGGLELQQRLQDIADLLPIIFVTAFPEIGQAVEAMKRGAVDFIAKPYDDEMLLAAVARALVRSKQARETAIARQQATTRLEALTAREREVLQKVAAGASSRMIAEELGISQRTVEVHRANMMHKAKAQNLAELLNLANLAGVLPVHAVR